MIDFIGGGNERRHLHFFFGGGVGVGGRGGIAFIFEKVSVDI